MICSQSAQGGWIKTEYFCWEGGLPEGARANLKLPAREVYGVQRQGFFCWVVAIGEKEYLAAAFNDKVKLIVEEAQESL